MTVATQRPHLKDYEGVFVGYVFNQALMTFSVITNYPHYKIEDGKLVKDTSETSTTLRQDADEARSLVIRMGDKIKAGARIPKTWIAKLEGHANLVRAARMTGATTQEWHDQFFRALRYLKYLQA